MTAPLNLVLYKRLREEFGSIIIAHPGVAASITYGYGPFLSENSRRMEMTTKGEYYRINCPWCGDTRHRLYISHLWGVPNEITNSKHLWLAHCFNEDCLAVEDRTNMLYDRVFGFKNAKLRGQQVVITPGVEEVETLQEIKPPGVILPLDKLHPSDQVISYLRARGINPIKLQEDYDVAYCLNAESDYPLAQNRIYIPVKMHGMLVGWQCRYPADVKKESRILKYYSRPGMPRRLILYNYDNAIKYPFVVLCEGPADVWNVGPYAVATFGKNPAITQIKLLCENWTNGAIVIMLDGDAWADTEKLVRMLQTAEYKGAIIPVRLPEDKDPGDLDISINYEYIISTANKMNIDLFNLQRVEDANINRTTEYTGISVSDTQKRSVISLAGPNYSFDLPRDTTSRS
jgi:hypothetical protein